MNIDAYYSRGGQGQSPSFADPRMTSPFSVGAKQANQVIGPTPMPTDLLRQDLPEGMVETEYGQMPSERYMRLMEMRNNQQGQPSMEEMSQREMRNFSDALYNANLRPQLGNIIPSTYKNAEEIYRRHFMNGTYGSPEMMAEINQLMGMVQQYEADRAGQPAPIGFAEYGQYATPGTRVIEPQYQERPNYQQFMQNYRQSLTQSTDPRSRMWRDRAAQAAGQMPTPGGAGGLLPRV